MNTRIGLIAFAAYIGCVFGANWAAQKWGLVDFPFGLQATAGTVFAGLSFTFRDAIQDGLGRPWTILGIIVGAALSWWVAPAFAVASGVAFLFSESCDFLVYTPLRERDWGIAVLASNVVGAFVDSWLFLYLAFDLATARSFWWDQTVIKIACALPFVAVIWLHKQRSGRDLPLGSD